MTRVLVTASGMPSHFAPLVPFIEALREGSHEVLLMAPDVVLERAASLGVPMISGGAPDPAELDVLWQLFRTASPSEASVIANREIFARLNTAAMLPGVEGAFRVYEPDFVLHEVTEYAGPFMAIRSGIPHAQVAISMAEAEAGSVQIAEPALAEYPGLAEALAVAPFLTRFPSAIDASPYADTRRYREPTPAPNALPDWWSGSTDPLVYVTFGTVAGSVSTAIFRAAIEALAPLPLRVLVTTGQQMDLGPVPPHIHVTPWVDQADVLAAAEAVLCHGGSGTTLGALAAGVPMVIYPMFADQRRNAVALAELGLARIVEPGGATAAERSEPSPTAVALLRQSVAEILVDGVARGTAQRLAAERAALPAPGDLLTGLVP